MNIDIKRTENEVIITLPSKSLPEDIDVALGYLRYLQLGAKSSITQQDVQDLIRITKGSWWKKNKHHFKDQVGFEDID